MSKISQHSLWKTPNLTPKLHSTPKQNIKCEVFYGIFYFIEHINKYIAVYIMVSGTYGEII